MVEMRRFEDKVVVVTGGSAGIGLAVARRVHAEGARVVLFARGVQQLSAAQAGFERNVLTVAGDARREEDLRRLFAETERIFGGVDALIVNAGLAEFIELAEVTQDHYERLFDTNVRGALLTVQRALSVLKPGSSVVLVTSVANTVGVAGTSVYGASKAAVRSLARTLGAELLPLGIRVNAVSPGPTESTIHAKYAATMTPAALEQMGAATFARLKMGRMAKAEETAAAIAFLASPESSFIVGQELAVDGGITAL
jgi:NAD(P)-dependent dehydrogenase (short-subunit alcohol dehydrogenase family)